jgi:hypothetical protein
MDFCVSCVYTNKAIIVFIFLNNPLITSSIPRKVSTKGEPLSLSEMKVMGIRNCVSVRLNVTDLVW